MAKYLSNRQKNLKIGIGSYTDNNTVLEVTGKIGIGTTNASDSLDVVGVVINQQTGTISGTFYSKSLFSTMTPFILALGGD